MKAHATTFGVLTLSAILAGCSHTPYKVDEALALHSNPSAKMEELGYIRPSAGRGFKYDYGTVFYNCRVTRVDTTSIPETAVQLEVEPGNHVVAGECRAELDDESYRGSTSIPPVWSTKLDVKAGYRWKMQFEVRQAMSGPKPHMYWQSYEFK